MTKLLIQAYLAKGDRTAARQVFESHQVALEELDLGDADKELVDLYDQAQGRRTAAG